MTYISNNVRPAWISPQQRAEIRDHTIAVFIRASRAQEYADMLSASNPAVLAAIVMEHYKRGELCGYKIRVTYKGGRSQFVNEGMVSA